MVRDAQAANATTFVDYTAAFSLVAIAVVTLAIWRAGHRPAALSLWLAVGGAVLSLGPFLYVASINTLIPLPWAVLRYVPLVGAARSPARFAVVAALGLALLFAGALAALGQRFPRRRRLIMATVALCLAFELCPVPRTLYSAEIPAIYRTIARDPRPLRIVELPFGVRDGVSSAGNFSARYLYHQTAHGKRLMGGYLSRIPRRRLEDMRAQPTLDALLRLSEGNALTPEQEASVRTRAPAFLRRADIGYVVIDHDRAPTILVDFVVDVWRLEEMEREGSLLLYRPTAVADDAIMR
jgi:hypothetical protein